MPYSYEAVTFSCGKQVVTFAFSYFLVLTFNLLLLSATDQIEATLQLAVYRRTVWQVSLIRLALTSRKNKIKVSTMRSIRCYQSRNLSSLADGLRNLGGHVLFGKSGKITIHWAQFCLPASLKKRTAIFLFTDFVKGKSGESFVSSSKHPITITCCLLERKSAGGYHSFIQSFIHLKRLNFWGRRGQCSRKPHGEHRHLGVPWWVSESKTTVRSVAAEDTQESDSSVQCPPCGSV